MLNKTKVYFLFLDTQHVELVMVQGTKIISELDWYWHRTHEVQRTWDSRQFERKMKAKQFF